MAEENGAGKGPEKAAGRPRASSGAKGRSGTARPKKSRAGSGRRAAANPEGSAERRKADRRIQPAAPKGPSVSIIVPCLNEAENIRGTVESIKDALTRSGRFSAYEILIFDDYSTDDTGRIIDELEKAEQGVRAIHNPKNMGFGYNYTEGVRQAVNDYVIMVPGDNEIPAAAIERVFAEAGRADVVIPYTANMEVRPFARRVISRAFVMLFNTLFGLKLKYYNGTCMIKSALLKEVPMTTWGFAYMAAILVRLLKSGASYVEVGVNITQRSTGKTKAFKVKNILSVLGAIAGLFWDVRVKERARYSTQARRVAAG